MNRQLIWMEQNVQKAVDMVNEVHSWIDEIPPLDQPMRFGNKSFRTFYDRVVEVSENIIICCI